MAGLINFHGTLYFSNPATTTGRNHMTLKKSLDSGASWEVVSLIYAGPAAYSLVVPLTNTSLVRRKRPCFSTFPYVCPEPVLVKR